MILKKIVLRNFRNYREEELYVNDKFNFIYGNNGQGKTNILEAVSLTAFGKSFLGSSESDCVKFGETGFHIESDYENDLGNRDNISVNYNLVSKSKLTHRNREKVNVFSSEIFGRYPLVCLSPKSLDITYGNPSERRRFFDIMISQTSRVYLGYLKELAKILKQKNALLKNYSVYRKYSYDELKNLLASYNEKFVEISSHIIFKRLNFLTDFRKYFKKNFSFLSNPDHHGLISYFSDIFENNEIYTDISDTKFISECLNAQIEKKSDDEINRAVTLTGPQRDDYIFRLDKSGRSEEVNSANAFEIKYFASQGEHKTFLIALKLSEYDFLKDKKSTSPVILLDDVLSELDESRVSKIISHLKDYGQIFLTTTDRNYKKNLLEFYEEKEISEFRIENGRVIS
jgi:DNA replication and repair protein RecF